MAGLGLGSLARILVGSAVASGWIWLAFTRILAGSAVASGWLLLGFLLDFGSAFIHLDFGLIWLDFDWIRLGFLHFRLLLLGLFFILASS